MAWCFTDEDDDHYARAVLRALDADAKAVVPGNWPYEVANVLLVACRRERIDEPRSLQFLAMLHGLPIGPDESATAPSGLFEVGRRFKLESYDAAYLDLAMRIGAPLATSDLGLRRAARRARVGLFAP